MLLSQFSSSDKGASIGRSVSLSVRLSVHSSVRLSMNDICPKNCLITRKIEPRNEFDTTNVLGPNKVDGLPKIFL